MNTFSRPNPKIDPFRRSALSGKTKPDGSPNDNDRVEIGPTDLAFAEWAAMGLEAPKLEAIRETRLKRVCDQLKARDMGGALFFDPLNIRYVSDSLNMQIWTMHNLSRACFVSADGHMVLWDFHGCDHMSSYLPLIKEVRHGASFFYFMTGDQSDAKAAAFAGQLDELLRAHAGNNRRLAVDKIEVPGIAALMGLGIELHDGQAVAEHARAVKSAEEIKAMRCAIATCEIAMSEMEAAMKPGMAEVELWAILHAENIKRGGEWIETRILSSGARTNPWMAEAGPRTMHEGDIVAFDTDLVGPYGMCCDMSRTWLCGDGKATEEQRRLYRVAHDHIMTNKGLLKPGVSFTEITQKGHKLPEEFVAQRYGVMMHGVGLCDEYPAIFYPQDHIEGAFDYHLEPGMVLCVEAYIGAVGGKEGIKLEDQVLITESGFEDLCTFHFDQRLLA